MYIIKSLTNFNYPYYSLTINVPENNSENFRPTDFFAESLNDAKRFNTYNEALDFLNIIKPRNQKDLLEIIRLN